MPLLRDLDGDAVPPDSLALLLGVTGDFSGSGVEPVLALEQAGQDEAALAMAEQPLPAASAPPLPHLEAARLGLKLGRETAFIETHLQAARALSAGQPAGPLPGSALVKEGQGDDARRGALYLEAAARCAAATPRRGRDSRRWPRGARTGRWPRRSSRRSLPRGTALRADGYSWPGCWRTPRSCRRRRPCW